MNGTATYEAYAAELFRGERRVEIRQGDRRRLRKYEPFDLVTPGWSAPLATHVG